MKFLILSVVAVCASLAAANVVVTSLNVEQPKSDVGRQDVVTEATAAPPVAPKKCQNATVNTQDCSSVIVTRLPFLFNFQNLNRVCDCDDGQLRCERGVGSNFFQRFQIPALRLVYNTNCKCKCPIPVPIPDVVEASSVRSDVQ